MLNNAIENFFLLVAPRLTIQPAIKALEWLVRRFQAHIHNAESFLLMALPYYNSPVFMRVLDTIALPLPPIFTFLNNSKKTVKNPSRSLLIRAMAADYELNRLVSSYVVNAIKKDFGYQRLLTFWSSMSIWVILLMKEKGNNEEDIVDRIISDLSDIIRLRKHSEAQIAAYMIFSVLGSQFQLSPEIFNATIQSIALNWSESSQKSGLAAITQIVKGKNEDLQPFDSVTFKTLFKNASITPEILSISESHNIHKFITIWSLSLLEYSQDDLSNLTKILTSSNVTESELEAIFKKAVSVATDSKITAKSRANLTTIFEHILSGDDKSKQALFKSVLDESEISLEALELALQASLPSIEILTSDVNETEQDVDTFKPVATPAEVKHFEATNILSFFDKNNTALFQERAEAFSQLAPFESLSSALQELKIDEDQAVTFLARVWTNTSYPAVVRADAVKLFVEITEKNSGKVDYQGLIGELLMGLSDNSERVRRLIVSSLTKILESYEKGSKLPVWGSKKAFNASKIAWISFEKVKLIVKALTEKGEEFVVSAHSVYQILGELLTSPEKVMKSAVSQLYENLVSQVTFLKVPAINLGLLRILNRYDKNNRASNLEIFLNSWLNDRDEVAKACELEKVSFEELESEVFDIISRGENGAGITFLQSCIKSGDSDLAEKASKKIVEIWETLRSDTTKELFSFLIDFAVDGELNFDPTEILFSVPISTKLFINVLNDCKLENSSSPTGSAGIPKRRRRSSGAAKAKIQNGDLANVAERHLKITTLILEVLERNKVEGNVDLLGQLFVILGEVLTLGADSALPVNYTQQVLANCMIQIVNGLKNEKNLKLDSNAMRVDILVSCIRSSTSQQVQNRFLLLVANLASLASDVVLHSVMPIFTFMGANTIRQDDEFSAHVIQQTITQVIPALLSQKKENNVEEIDFLLLSFVAAFAHIPRHRRVRLFSTLVRTLGSGSALHCLLFLLGQKYFEAKQKRKIADSKSLLQFAESFIRSFTVEEQFNTIKNFLDLVNQIPLEELSEEDKKKADTDFKKRQTFSSIINYSTANLISLRSTLAEYLASIITNGDTISDIPSLRVNTAVLFKESSQKQELISTTSVNIINEILKTLSQLREVKSDKSVISSYHVVLDSFLELLPINVFVDILKDILLVSDSEKTKQQSLILLRSKFDLESASDEEAFEAAKIAFKVLSNLIANKSTDKILIQQAFNSLELIVFKFGNLFDPKELLQLLDLVVSSQGLLNDDTEVLVSSVSVINSLFSILGARAIGYFAKTIPVLFKKFEASISKSDADSEEDESSQLIQLSTFGLVAGLVKRIPAFMNSSLVNIFKLLFLSTVSIRTRQILMENISINMEAKTVLNALTQTWTYAVQGGWNSIALHLDCLDSVISTSDRKTVSSQSTNLVSFLLKAFEVRGETETYDQNTIHRIEGRTIKSGIQIVMKLNDKTFRPLFVRMVRWGIDGEGTSMKTTPRQIVFFKFLTKLFGNLKSIITSYFSYLIDPVAAILDASVSSETESLQVAVLNTLTVSFLYDREEFWQSQTRFTKILTSLLAQLTVPSTSLVKALTTLAESVSSSAQHKAINEGLLAHMQPESSETEKLWSVRVMKNLYAKLGEEWVTMLPQLVPVLAELLEDDSEAVEQEVRKELVPVVEEVLGESLDRYLA